MIAGSKPSPMHRCSHSSHRPREFRSSALSSSSSFASADGEYSNVVGPTTALGSAWPYRPLPPLQDHARILADGNPYFTTKASLLRKPLAFRLVPFKSSYYCYWVVEP